MATGAGSGRRPGPTRHGGQRGADPILSRHGGQRGADPVLSRRRVLALSAATLLSGAGAALHPRWLASTVPVPAPGVPGSRAGGSSAGAGLPLAPVPVRARPVFGLADLMPDAPATAVALTLDDGPDPRWTPQVLAVLERYQVPATFSLIGRQATAHPALVRRIVAGGHTLCNHSMTHPLGLARASAATVRRQVVDAQAAIADAAGVAPRLFRTPGGRWSPAVLETAAAAGMVPVDWNVDPRDWTRPGSVPIARRMLHTRPGDILLAHDGGGNRAQTVAALGRALPVLLRRGVTFLPLRPDSGAAGQGT